MSKPVMLISGTRKGIGRYLAEYYAGKGFQVVGFSRQPFEGKLEGYTHFIVDITDEEGLVGLFSTIRKTFGRLDCLLNNAGVGSMNHILLTPTKTVRAILETNVIGTVVCCREAAKLMK